MSPAGVVRLGRSVELHSPWKSHRGDGEPRAPRRTELGLVAAGASSACTCRPVRVVVAPIRSATTWRLVSGRPRQFIEMWLAEASLVLVVAARVAAEETSRLLREAVTSARSAGHSWDVVGRLLGVSRQAAQQRFGTTGPEPLAPGTADVPQRRVLSPLTAFTEMAVLEREGRAGWHVVDYGNLFHVLEASDVPSVGLLRATRPLISAGAEVRTEVLTHHPDVAPRSEECVLGSSCVSVGAREAVLAP